MKLIFGSRNLIFKKWGQDNERPPKNVVFIGGFLVRLIGIEPTHPAPEAGALSTELQAHIVSLKHRAYILYQTFQKKARGFPKFFRFFLRLYAFAKKFDFFQKALYKWIDSCYNTRCCLIKRQQMRIWRNWQTR